MISGVARPLLYERRGGAVRRRGNCEKNLGRPPQISYTQNIFIIPTGIYNFVLIFHL